MAQRLPVQRINTGPQALRHAQRKLKQPYYSTTRPGTSSLTDTFDNPFYVATGVGAAHQAAPSFSWTDNIPASANCAVVWLSTMPGSNDVATVTIGGTSATAVSGNPFVYDATSGYNGIQCFVLMNPPTGSKTVTVTFPGTNYVNATVVYYGGVGSVGTPTSTSGAGGTQPSQLATTTAGRLYAQAFSYRASAGGNTFPTYSGGIQRAVWPCTSYDQPIIVGDAIGNGSSLTFSATRNDTGYSWGGVAVPLLPIPADKWANWGAASIVNGQLVCTPNSSYSSGVTSVNPYDLTGSSVSVQLVQPPNVGTGSIETGFHISCANGSFRHSFLLANGNRGHFSDDFNRADGAIGAAWSAAGSPEPVIYNNQFVAPTQGNWSGANSNSYATTTDHQVSVRIGTITAGSTQIQLNVRVGPGNMMMSWWDGSAPTFSYNPGNVTVATGPVANFRTGDIITFAALGNVYTLYVNGGVVMTWTDTDSVFAYDNTYTGTLIGVQSNGANNCGFDDFWFDDIGRDLSFQTTVGGVVSTVASTTYDPINHDFLRIREAGGTVYYETSEDGSSWDIRASTPSVFSLSSVYVQLYAGYWGAETSPGTVLFDNLNLPVSNPVYRPIKPVSRKTGPMALRQVIRQRPRAGPRPSVSPSQKISTFTESFDVLDPAVWMTMSGSPSFDGGDLVLPCASTYSTIMSVQSFDLNESSAYIDLQQTQAAGNGTTDTIFAVMSCCGHLVRFMVANGQLITDDTASGYTSTRAYNAVTHRFLRIRATGNGTLYWDTSPDASTWTQLATKAASSFAAGNVQVYLSCGYDGAETNPRSAIFDGLNLRPDWPNSRTTVKPVGRKVGPMALRQSRNLRRQQPYPRDVEGIFSSDSNLDVSVSATAEAIVDTPTDTSLAATATITAEADIYHGVWQLDSTTVAATATITAEATRNQFVTSSLATTATITDTSNFSSASTDAPQAVTATLTSTSTRNAIVDSSLVSTASATGGDKTNQVFTGTQTVTATINSAATRNAIVNASMPVTNTLSSIATKNFNVNASLAVTATPTSAVTLAASANAVLTTATATFTGTGTRGAVGNVSQTVTATFTPVFSRNQKLDAAQTITATGTAIESEAATGATPLALSAALTATATKNQFCDSAIQAITAAGSADSTRSVFADGSLTAWAAEGLPYTFPFFLGMPYVTATAVKGILGSLSVTADLSSTGTRNVGDDATLPVTAGRTTTMTWFSRADIMSLTVTATPTASVGKNQFISASLGITATATAISSTNHPADSSLSATAVVSSTFNADFLIDAIRAVTASLTGIGSRRQNLDAPLAVTANLTDVVKWAAKFQAALAVTGTPVVIGLRDAKVNGPLVITVTSSQYMFQTEQFDIITGVVAQPIATMNISTSADSSTDITVSNPAEGLRVSFIESTLDVTSEALIETARNVYGDSRLEVWNASEGAVNWDGLFGSVLEVLADLPSLLNQGLLVEVSLDLDAEATANMWIEALLDALLTAETMALDAYGIRDQYAEALQEISVTVINETQWNIQMHAILVVPASVFADGRSGQVSSNFFVFYI